MLNYMIFFISSNSACRQFITKSRYGTDSNVFYGCWKWKVMWPADYKEKGKSINVYCNCTVLMRPPHAHGILTNLGAGCFCYRGKEKSTPDRKICPGSGVWQNKSSHLEQVFLKVLYYWNFRKLLCKDAKLVLVFNRIF